MDKARVDAALQAFSVALPELPEWVILVRTNGEFISRIGEYPYFYPRAIDDETAALWTHAHGTHLLSTLEHVNHGGLECSVTFGGNGTFFLVHLNYAFFLGVSFSVIINSVNDTIENMFIHCHPILEAVNPSFPT